MEDALFDYDLEEDENENINYGNQYYKEVFRINLLTPEEEKRLFNEYKNGNLEARKRIIEANLRLVINIAKKYQSKAVSFNERVSDGNLGLIKAVKTFDVDRNLKFSTYASKCIANEIIYGIREKSSSVTSSQDILNKYHKISKELDDLVLKLGKIPTEQEILDNLNITKTEYKELLNIKVNALSLNLNLDQNDNDSITYQDTIVDRTVNIENDYMKKDLAQVIDKILNTIDITEREKEIIKLRFGFSCSPMSLEEVGKKFNVKRQRINQIEHKVFYKIKQYNVKNHELDQYL